MTLFERLNARYRTFESPLAVGGNWNGDIHTKSLLGDFFKNGFLSNWTKFSKQVNETEIKDLEFYFVKSSKNPGIINCVGVIYDPSVSTSGVYRAIIALVLDKYDEEVYKGRDVYQTTRVQLSDLSNLSSRGLATSLYSTLIESGYILICDSVQYDGARNLWRKLSNRYIVDVFDGLSGSVTKTHHKIIKTDIDDLDEEWSSGFSQKHENLLFTVRKDKNVQLSDEVER